MAEDEFFGLRNYKRRAGHGWCKVCRRWVIPLKQRVFYVCPDCKMKVRLRAYRKGMILADSRPRQEVEA